MCNKRHVISAIFLVFSAVVTQVHAAGVVVILGQCDAALKEAHGFAPPPAVKVGNSVRLFTSERKWVAATIEQVQPAKVTLRVGRNLIDMEMPGQGHYIDFRDPSKFPQTLRHPLQYGIKLGGVVYVPKANGERTVRLYVVKIDIYSGRFFGQPSLPPEMQPRGFHDEFIDRSLTRSGHGYSIPFDYPGLTFTDPMLEQSADSW